MTYLNQFMSNKPIGTAVLSWAIAQLIKIIIDLIQNKRLDYKLITASGGMPSSHSSFVTALSTYVGLSEGFDSSYFAICFVVSMVVMYDAAGVRRAAGKQAAVINRIVALMKDYSLKDYSPKNEEILKEILGHTPFEVVAGAILGICLAVIRFFW